ncbi:MAG: hypothetical protein GC187_04225 [Alphaproteobacteria bacterium]|nr:hypothetical protein [Alphaproteobacteria bacterium]
MYRATLAAMSAFALTAAPALAEDADALFAQGQRLLEEANALFAQSELSQSNWTGGEARTALRAACELDHIEACKVYGQSMRGAAFLGDQRSMNEQYWGYGHACDLGDGQACLELGDARAPIGMFPARSTPENWTAAEAAYRRACDEHQIAEGCERLAEVLSHESNPNHAAQAAPSPASALTWDEADRPGTMRRLFDASLRSPELEPQARGLIAEEVARLAAASTVENGYGPLRGFITESMGLVNSYEGDENDAARGLLHDSIVQGTEGAPVAMPRFLYNWIRPGGHTGPDRPRPQQQQR